MKKVIKKHVIKVSIGLLFIFLILIVLWVGSAYYLDKESRENDSLPIVLNNSVVMTRVDDSLYSSVEYRDGDDCFPDEEEMILQTTHEKSNKEIHIFACKKLIVNKGIFYWMDKNLEDLVVLEKLGTGNAQLVIRQTGGYPGNSVSNVRRSTEDVIFTYTGWNNPKKILKLTVK